MIVSKYFMFFSDFVNLEIVCKKFKGNMEKFHFNPIPLTNKTIKHFPSIETLNLWSEKDETFGNHIKSIMPKKMVFSEILKSFYRVRVFYPITYQDYLLNIKGVFMFFNVCYTQDNKNSFGKVIPQSVTSLNINCYYNDNTLKSIDIPNQVSFIGGSCFYSCQNLVRVVLPNNLRVLQPYTFCQCNSLIDINIPNRVVSIGNSCFYNCKKLESVTLGNCVTSVGQQCFYCCKNLTKINTNNSIVEIGFEAFKYCDKLEINKMLK
ncbi:hypothetical protein EIN_322460 [Entamoeba invadens IP1]|uniref:Leucine rich repeat containing protein BspA family protein n=1 Tax=Entamoeba invadens IP1 TaxID=370355 RepID=A0A0A1UCW6_ENTIV|nr:hypothetical protein EIN_322460 [Entamoeba invadens IP1]ELP93753.1 hypothetical protein EIN_322460 [Entamoeba invadens IP1]|eukprot:XP_004260524.1 hypothetical protein EIN_322460 [Entamoeba invadens IP1]